MKPREMSVEEIKRLKKKYGLSNAKLSDESNVPLGTVNKVLGGATETPRSETLAALAAPLRAREREEQREKSCVYLAPGEAPSDALLMEEAVRYGVPADKIPGTFTIDDYYNLPDQIVHRQPQGKLHTVHFPSRCHSGSQG